MRQVEIAVIGAGVAGLTCARQLREAGRSVVLVDKSRGLGGRLATRRLVGTHADHGVCYITPKGDVFGQFIADLCDRGIVWPWTDGIYSLDGAGYLHEPTKRSPCYVAENGATAIAKDLANGLEVIGQQRVVALTPIEKGWELQSEDGTLELSASNVVIAIPAPQAVMIVGKIAGFDKVCLARLRSLEFAPSITVIAAYPASLMPQAERLDWQGVQCIDHAELGWIGLDSSKQVAPVKPTVIVQSSAKFAARYFESSDLSAVGMRLLDRAAKLASWISQPEELQVHRWRYAFASNPLVEKYLKAHAHAPLYFCGDWCGGDRVEAAYLSGLALGQAITGKFPG